MSDDERDRSPLPCGMSHGREGHRQICGLTTRPLSRLLLLGARLPPTPLWAALAALVPLSAAPSPPLWPGYHSLPSPTCPSVLDTPRPPLLGLQ